VSRIGKSEAQANAEALARRSSTYADDHARSWTIVFSRHEPPTLRDLVRELRRAYRMDMPERMHRVAVDGGGTPSYTGEFAAHLYGSPMALDPGDQDHAVYRTPLLAALHRCTGTRGAIVRAVVITGDGPVDAALAQGIPADVAKLTSEAVLRWFWRGMSSGPLPPTPSTS
jgi:hypothetical protein